MDNIWLNGIMGVIIGDALGCPVQFLSREEISKRPSGKVVDMEEFGTYNMPKGTWTDDGSMTLATLDSIVEKQKIDLNDIMLRFVKWEINGEYTQDGEAFDQGNTCSMSIYNYIDNLDVSTCGKTGEHANGNGALMRIIPACLYSYKRLSEDDMVKTIHQVSGLTHNHIRSKMCCVVYSNIVKAVLDRNGDTLLDIIQNGIDEAISYYKRNSKAYRFSEIAHLGRLFELSDFKDTESDKIKTTGYVIDTIEAAIWCLINTNSFEECLLEAVNLGDDTDTVAAIAGGIAGLYYGVEGMPNKWIEAIRQKEYFIDICNKANKLFS